jgi:hypothetical protein
MNRCRISIALSLHWPAMANFPTGNQSVGRVQPYPMSPDEWFRVVTVGAAATLLGLLLYMKYVASP